MKNIKNIKIQELKKIHDSDCKSIIKLIYQENPRSILASLNKNIVKQYLNKVTSSKSVLLFVLKLKKKIIGYAVIAKKTESLISIISMYKINILFLSIKNLRIFTLINLFLIFFKIDTFFLKNKTKKIIKQNYNLNLLAINKQYQSKGYGSYFLKKILKKVQSKFITVETIDDKAKKFYETKHEFKLLGVKLRIFKNQKILYKKII